MRFGEHEDARVELAEHDAETVDGIDLRAEDSYLVDVLHQTGGDPEYSNALDAALTYSIRFP